MNIRKICVHCTYINEDRKKKGVGTMVDYEGLLEEANAKAEEANAKAIRNILKSWHRLGQDCTAARAYVLEEYPDIDIKSLDSIISEVYNLQQV